MAGARYDVFVSYSHADAAWVRGTLVPRLEENGFSVMIDYRDFSTGSLGIDKMQRGVEQSRHVLLVLTSDYIKSDWSHFENAMAQASDPAARGERLSLCSYVIVPHHFAFRSCTTVIYAPTIHSSGIC